MNIDYHCDPQPGELLPRRRNVYINQRRLTRARRHDHGIDRGLCRWKGWNRPDMRTLPESERRVMRTSWVRVMFPICMTWGLSCRSAKLGTKSAAAGGASRDRRLGRRGDMCRAGDDCRDGLAGGDRADGHTLEVAWLRRNLLARRRVHAARTVRRAAFGEAGTCDQLPDGPCRQSAARVRSLEDVAGGLRSRRVGAVGMVPDNLQQRRSTATAGVHTGVAVRKPVWA